MYPNLPLIIGSDGKGNIYWSVDAAFAVHLVLKNGWFDTLNLRILKIHVTFEDKGHTFF